MPVNTRTVGSGSWKAICLALAILIMCSAPAIAAQKISRIQVANLSDKVQVGVTGSEAITYSVKRTGRFLAIDVNGYYTPAGAGRVKIASDKIYGVKYGRFRPTVTRIAFSTKGAVRYNAKPVNDGKQLLIDVWKSEKSAAKPTAAAPTPVAAIKSAPKLNLALCMVPAIKSTPSTEPQPATAAIAPTAVMGVAEAVVGEPKVEDTEDSAPAPVVVAAVPSATAAPTSPAHITKRAVDSSDTSAREPKNISLDFHAADINDVLKALSLQSGKNIVTGTDVKGNVTVTLAKASLDQALDYVATLSGYRYAKADDNTYLVGNNVGAATGTVSSDPIVTEAVTLRLATPDQGFEKMLSDMVPGLYVGYLPPAKGSAADSSGAKDDKKASGPQQKSLGAVILRGPASLVATAKEAIKKLEDSLGQYDDGSVTQLYKIKYADACDLTTLANATFPVVSVSFGPTLGFRIDGKETIKLGLSGGGAGDYEIKNQPAYLVLTGPEAQVKQAVALLDQVDVKQPQIRIEARVVDLNNDAAKELGVTWDWEPFVYRQNVPDLDKAAARFPLPPTKGLSHMPLGFSAVLDAMVTSGRGKLLANPSVNVLEGKPANIFIGDQVKYVININQGVNGTNVTTETANVGVQLQVIGKVNSDSLITLNIRPEVSVITDFLEVAGLALPQISSRYTASTIRVKDGDTVVIGGLIKDSDITSMRKVPLLGDLPFFGNLFRHRSTSRTHSEVVISITAKIVSD